MPSSDSQAIGEGLRVIMRSISGLTPSGILDVPFLFQCPPIEDFQEQYAFNHNDYMTAFAGERSRAAGRQLAVFPFDSLVLDDIPSWSLIQDYIPNPILVKRELKEIHDAGHPFQLLVHEIPLWGYYDVNVAATIRSLTVQQKHGETDSRYFSIQFKEYRDVRIDMRTLGGSAGTSAPSRGPVTKPVRELQSNERSLQMLAKTYLGGASEWPQIAAVPGNNVANVGPSEDLRVAFADDPNAKITVPGTPGRAQLDEDVPELGFVG